MTQPMTQGQMAPYGQMPYGQPYVPQGQVVYSPAQPMMAAPGFQPMPQIGPNLFDPRTYEGIQWSDSIAHTVSGGVPAWGKGQFESTMAYLAWFAACFGFSGMQRIYLGDMVMGVLYCLTGGFCGIGQWIDLCLLSGMIDDKNGEIMNAVRSKMVAQSNVQPQVVVQMGQPGIATQGAYQVPGYSPPTQMSADNVMAEPPNSVSK
ncbi:uncharacterized protein MONOS_7313 [Monocercomonoides exilis]|uniref:uncharacterized protein n=1 Tax=Monocercomonoides exilis TaxID=2049356 RepID=UPI0035597159|nr:hypothetical protein MONOS_7313 [Monocercomonoides exilis]|eukprot:MONOS_7313.1-p1 / transcript=MONOS_7313.1 / gene=MONOS_7313 / organism=Monocercomonoides_exilis_PA203 / gene_product=unspecified product / transcript_product=unspecified product / location=Mono_scaffold00247:47927-48541(+) / protein_length=204 / sequence_SO=supercontig / SO=protein_coding / is_pseudo=false